MLLAAAACSSRSAAGSSDPAQTEAGGGAGGGAGTEAGGGAGKGAGTRGRGGGGATSWGRGWSAPQIPLGRPFRGRALDLLGSSGGHTCPRETNIQGTNIPATADTPIRCSATPVPPKKPPAPQCLKQSHPPPFPPPQGLCSHRPPEMPPHGHRPPCGSHEDCVEAFSSLGCLRPGSHPTLATLIVLP